MNLTTKKEGIDLLKKVITNVVNAAKEYQEAKADDKITKIELLGFGDNVIAIGSNLMKANEIAKQAVDVDSDEAQELMVHIESLGFFGEKGIKILKHSINIVVGEYQLIKSDVLPLIEVIKNE